VKKILILTANPKDTDRLRLDEEVREITAALERSRCRDDLEVIVRWAARPDDLRRSLLDHEPDIVHFSGHGSGVDGIALESNAGKSQLVSSAALAKLFGAFKDKIRCVVLNACYSEVQAEAIHAQIETVIGMKRAIGDRAALEFAVGFYDGLFAGRSLSDAFELGCTSIDLEGIPEADTPALKIRSPSVLPIVNPTGLEGVKVFISYRSQDPDMGLAQEFYQTLQGAGYGVFMAAESIRLGDRWSDCIDQELATCDYFLLLLSEHSARSEMVTEEVRRAKELRDTRNTGKPVILPVRVNFPLSSPLNYDLRSYLNQIQQREWNSAADTAPIIQEILTLLTAQFDPHLPVESIALPLHDNPTAPPVPIAEPELPEGQVDLASGFYVERSPIEARCYEAIAKPGSLIRIKAPRQMGKTSLMARILHHAGQQDCLTVPLSFQIADAAVFGDLDKFLRWFCASVGRRLKLPNRLNEQWDEIFGSKDNCTAYFEEYLLTEIGRPLALGLDEVDMVFNHPEIASDFFGLLRAWHESAKSSDLWKKLRLVVVHSTEVYIPMNINQSPFNVGLPIELPEFDGGQVLDLARRHGLDWRSQQAADLMAMVGGHPYLVRMALYEVARGDRTLADLLQTAPTEAGLYCDHLRRHLWNLEQRPDMVAAVRRLVATAQPVRLESVQAFQLNSMGLVHLQGNEVVFRCDLYRQYFGDRLR
jgi:AAA-like domain/TIR domain/CHAT domain